MRLRVGLRQNRFQDIRNLEYGSIIDAAAFAVAISVGFFYPELIGYLLTVAFLIASSRIILGMHFFSDVIAGSTIGIILGFTAFHIFAAL